MWRRTSRDAVPGTRAHPVTGADLATAAKDAVVRAVDEDPAAAARDAAVGAVVEAHAKADEARAKVDGAHARAGAGHVKADRAEEAGRHVIRLRNRASLTQRALRSGCPHVHLPASTISRRLPPTV